MAADSERPTRRHIQRPYELAAALRAARREQGLTQANLAALADTSRQWVCDAENNKLPFGVTLVCRIIHELGYQIELVPTPPDPGIDLDAHLAALPAPEL